MQPPPSGRRQRMLAFAAVPVLVALLTTCENDRPAHSPQGPDQVASDSTICLSDSLLEFDDQATPEPQAIVVTGCNSAASWSARPSEAWLSISPPSGSGGPDGDSVVVAVDWWLVIPDLSQHAEVVFEGFLDTVTLNLTAYRHEADEAICLSDSMLEFDDQTAPGPQAIAVSGCNSAASWSAQTSHDWLSVSPQSGRGGSDGDTVTVAVDWLSISPDTVLGAKVTFQGLGRPTTLDLTVYRHEVDESICLSDSTLEFHYATAPEPQTIFVSGCSRAVSWSAQTSHPWLLVSPETGGGGPEGDRVTIAVDWLNISPNIEWNAEVTFKGEGDPTTLSLTAYRHEVGDPDLCVYWPYGTQYPPLPWEEGKEPVRYLTIENCGTSGYILDWTVTATEPWLLFEPASGTNRGAGELDTVAVTVDWAHAYGKNYADATLSIVSDVGRRDIAIRVQPDCRTYIVEPNSSTVVTAGDYIPLSYLQTGDQGIEWSWRLYKGNQVLWEQDGLPGWDFYAFTFGHGTGSDYRIMWCYCACASSDYFTIVVPPTLIEIWRPGRMEGVMGEPYHVVGQTRKIQWLTPNAGDSVSVDLLLDGVVLGRVIDWTPNDGFAEWTVTDFGMGWNSYQVRISDTHNPDHFGVSREFTITPP